LLIHSAADLDLGADADQFGSLHLRLSSRGPVVTVGQIYMHRILFIIAVSAFLAGCAATPYQPIGINDEGGYSTTRLGKNRFYVVFEGNENTEVQQAHDYAFLRGAEVTQEYGYSCFSVSSEGQGGSLRLSFDSGFFPSPMIGNTMIGGASVRSHRYGIQITCFETAPDASDHQGKIYEATEVIREMKEKYNIK
jgi:hypothetical protein